MKRKEPRKPLWKSIGSDTITDDMISNYEANVRSTCLFCGESETEHIETHITADIPEGFHGVPFSCPDCGRAWMEIIRFEEIKPI